MGGLGEYVTVVYHGHLCDSDLLPPPERADAAHRSGQGLGDHGKHVSGEGDILCANIHDAGYWSGVNESGME